MADLHVIYHLKHIHINTQLDNADVEDKHRERRENEHATILYISAGPFLTCVLSLVTCFNS